MKPIKCFLLFLVCLNSYAGFRSFRASPVRVYSRPIPVRAIYRPHVSAPRYVPRVQLPTKYYSKLNFYSNSYSKPVFNTNTWLFTYLILQNKPTGEREDKK